MHLILYTFEVNVRYYKHLLRAYTIHLDDVFRITIPVWKCFDHLQKTRLPLRVIETKTRRRRNHLIHGIFLLRTCQYNYNDVRYFRNNCSIWPIYGGKKGPPCLRVNVFRFAYSRTSETSVAFSHLWNWLTIWVFWKGVDWKLVTPYVACWHWQNGTMNTPTSGSFSALALSFCRTVSFLQPCFLF